MAEREIEAWVTINGARVPIFKGESKQDAVNRHIAKSNEDKKQSDIARNQKEAQKAQQSQQQLPKRLDLPNISAKDANKSSDVLNLKTKQRFRFKEGTEITNVYVFAGKGCSKVFRDAEKYAKRWGGKAEDWQHCAGIAQIINKSGTTTLTREVHWVQGKDGKIREAFIKFHEKRS